MTHFPSSREKMLRRFQRLFFSLLFLFTITPGYGAERQKEPDIKSRIELHAKMAVHHQKAADCLKAGGSVEKCNQEAMKDCPMMKSVHCPFMEDHMDHMNMMKDKKISP